MGRENKVEKKIVKLALANGVIYPSMLAPFQEHEVSCSRILQGMVKKKVLIKNKEIKTEYELSDSEEFEHWYGKNIEEGITLEDIRESKRKNRKLDSSRLKNRGQILGTLLQAGIELKPAEEFEKCSNGFYDKTQIIEHYAEEKLAYNGMRAYGFMKQGKNTYCLYKMDHFPIKKSKSKDMEMLKKIRDVRLLMFATGEDSLRNLTQYENKEIKIKGEKRDANKRERRYDEIYLVPNNKIEYPIYYLPVSYGAAVAIKMMANPEWENIMDEFVFEKNEHLNVGLHEKHLIDGREGNALHLNFLKPDATKFRYFYQNAINNQEILKIHNLRYVVHCFKYQRKYIEECAKENPWMEIEEHAVSDVIYTIIEG